MVDSPREVIGAVLKYLGASYNTSNIDSEVTGGRNAVKDELAALRKQVWVFENLKNGVLYRLIEYFKDIHFI